MSWTCEDLTVDAAAELDAELQARVARDMDDWQRCLRAARQAQAAGIRTAPYWRRSLRDLVASEAERRSAVGDPVEPVWRALAESVDVAERAEAIGRACL